MTKQRLYLLGILILALSFRLFHVSDHGLWLDEKTTLLNAVGLFSPSTEVWQNPDRTDSFYPDYLWKENTSLNVVESTLMKSGGNNQGFNLLLHFWITVFGVSDLALRSLSILFGLLTVVMGVVMIRKILGNDRLANIFGLLLACHPLLITYSQELRAYSAVAAIALLSTLLAFQLFNPGQHETRKLQWVAYGGLVVLGILSHYLIVSIFAGHSLYFLLNKPSSQHWRGLAWATVIPVLFTIGWLVMGGVQGVQEILARSQEYGELVGVDESMKTTAYMLAAGLVQDLVHVFGNSLQHFGIKIIWLLPMLLLPGTMLYLVFKSRDASIRNLAQLVLITLCLVFLTAALLAVSSGHTISLRVTYFVMVAPLAVLLVAIGINEVQVANPTHKNVLRAALILQVAIMLVSIWPTYIDINSSVGPREVNPYAQAAVQLTEKYVQGDVVVYSNWMDAKLLNVYFRNQNIEQRVTLRKEDGPIYLERNGEPLWSLSLEGKRY